jgi:hypothetical protein
MRIDQGLREWIESTNSAATAATIFDRLPKSDEELQLLLAQGQAVAQRMSWEVVSHDYLLPGLRRAMK